MSTMKIERIPSANFPAKSCDPMLLKILEDDMEAGTIELKNEIVKLCTSRNISYFQINKALYSADRELYFRTIYKA